MLLRKILSVRKMLAKIFFKRWDIYHTRASVTNALHCYQDNTTPFTHCFCEQHPVLTNSVFGKYPIIEHRRLEVAD